MLAGDLSHVYLFEQGGSAQVSLHFEILNRRICNKKNNLV